MIFIVNEHFFFISFPHQLPSSARRYIVDAVAIKFQNKRFTSILSYNMHEIKMLPNYQVVLQRTEHLENFLIRL